MVRIAIVTGSTRPGRKSLAVAEWVYRLARERKDAEFELVDIADYELPLLDEPMPPLLSQYTHAHTKIWSERIASFDAYVFVTPEYNHSTSGALKNAIDYLYQEWLNKAAGFVSYGGHGGVRAVEHLRLILAKLMVATVRGQVALSLFAKVIATASGDDEAYLESIGAGQVIDYREARFENVLQEKVDVVFDLIGGDTQMRSFLVLKEGGHLVSAVRTVSQEEAARHRVSGEMMRLTPSADMLGRIAQLLEKGTIRPDVATVYALQDAAQAWKDIAGNLPGVHGLSPDGRGAARRRSHGKIVLRVA